MAIGKNVLQYVTISGSYQKFADEVARDLQQFRNRGVRVLSPHSTTILACVDGFVSCQDDIVPRIDRFSENDLAKAMGMIENSHLRAIQQSDALWLTIPNGYCGAATAFEMGWALAHGIAVFYDGKYSREVKEPMLRMYASPTNGIEELLHRFDSLPKVDPLVSRVFMKKILQPTDAVDTALKPLTPIDTCALNATIAVGPMIVDYSEKKYTAGQARDILLVKSHKWTDKFSIVGGRIQKKERIEAAFTRVIAEQTGVEAVVEEDICAFDEIPHSGYYHPGTSRLFVDKVARVGSRTIHLDERAQEYEWIPPLVALRDLDIEPNARRTLEIYAQGHQRVA